MTSTLAAAAASTAAAAAAGVAAIRLVVVVVGIVRVLQKHAVLGQRMMLPGGQPLVGGLPSRLLLLVVVKTLLLL